MRKSLVIALALLIATQHSAVADSVLNSDQKMVLIKTIGGTISPKSVLASDSGLISAHNMMYNHSVTIYDADKAELIATVLSSQKNLPPSTSSNSSARMPPTTLLENSTANLSQTSATL